MKCKFPNYINYIFLCLKLIIKHYHSQKTETKAGKIETEDNSRKKNKNNDL